MTLSGKDKNWNGDALNPNFVEPCIHKAIKCTKPDNTQNFNIGSFVLKIVSKIKISQ